MVKRKIYINDMGSDQQSLKGCFTDDSYVMVAIPSYKEKSRFVKEWQKIDRTDDIANFEILSAFITEVSCKSVDAVEDEITDFDNLMAFADGKAILDWLTNTVMHGFVPKKN